MPFFSSIEDFSNTQIIVNFPTDARSFRLQNSALNEVRFMVLYTQYVKISFPIEDDNNQPNTALLVAPLAEVIPSFITEAPNAS